MRSDLDDFIGIEDTPKSNRHAPRTQPAVAQRKIEKRRVDLDNATSRAIAEVDSQMAAFQDRQNQEAVAATVFSTAVSAALRREYLDVDGNICPQPNILSNCECNSQIQWLRLLEVGLQTDFSAVKASAALENVLSAFHVPSKTRVLFLVSSDETECGEKISIYLGLQAIGDFKFDGSVLNFVSGFSKANWPGLSFAPVNKVNFDFSTQTHASRPGVRIITGIPSGRDKESVCASVDKLAEALHGRSWRYLVIAEPVSSSEVEGTIRACRELAGRAESLKSVQVSESIGKSIGKNFNRSVSESNSTSEREMGLGRKLAIAGVVGTGVLSVVCPALLPAFLTTASTTAAGGVVAKEGLTLLASLLGGTLLAGAKNKTQGETITVAMAKTVSDSKNLSFAKTIINKHAEGVVKLIESQIKRFQLCEGVGAWETGVYFIGQDETTAEIGSNVLKSLISGDNSYQEPVRIFNPRGCAENASPLIAIRNFDNPYVRPMSSGRVISHPFGERYEHMTTVVNTRELTRLVNLPLSNVPGIQVKRIAADLGLIPPRDPQDDVKTIELGKPIYRGVELTKYHYSIPVPNIAKHLLVCGINGSGKTNTVIGILQGLRNKSCQIPFLVVEPAKQEYVDWAIKMNAELAEEYGKDLASKDRRWKSLLKNLKKDDWVTLQDEELKKEAEVVARADSRWINVFIPGREKWNGKTLDPLTLNPFDFVWMDSEEPPKILEHIDRLKTIINAALPMQEVLPVLMEELIYSVYGTKNSPVEEGGQYICWLPKDASSRTPKFRENIPVPSFVELANHIPEIFKRIQYGNEVQHNLRAALTTRVDSFKRGWKKPLLNKDLPRHTVLDWDNLFKHPTVINLTSLTSDDDKAFFMAIVLMFIYEYRQEESELRKKLGTGQSQELKHLLVIEEAHRILGRCDGAASAFSAAPKQKASEMFSNMISEVRAYGQGILIADQIPGRLNEDAVKNTNLKIVHRLVASDDRQSMATALNLWEDQERVIGDLNVGEALVRGDMDKEAYMVKVNLNT